MKFRLISKEGITELNKNLEEFMKKSQILKKQRENKPSLYQSIQVHVWEFIHWFAMYGIVSE